MIEGGDHLWNCLRYIDLNMVRAGVVRHPSEWEWCGYREIVGERKRFCVLEIVRLTNILGLSDRKSLADIHQRRISDAIMAGRMNREGIWTESVAVGSKAFLKEIVSRNRWRKKPCIAVTADGECYIAEGQSGMRLSKTVKKGPKNACKRLSGALNRM